MSDSDFEFIDASQVVSTQRQRKPKYKHRLWEDTSDYGMFRYYSALQSLERRRNKTSETKYDHLINPRMEYEQWWIDNTPSDLSMVKDEDVEVVFVTCDACEFNYSDKDCIVVDGWTICDDCSDTDVFVCESCHVLSYSYDMSDEDMICCDCQESEE